MTAAKIIFTLASVSVSASWLILAVLLARFLTKNAPKWTRLALWALVAVRLCVPLSLTSPFSVVPERLSGERVAERVSAAQTERDVGDAVPYTENVSQSAVNAEDGVPLTAAPSLPQTPSVRDGVSDVPPSQPAQNAVPGTPQSTFDISPQPQSAEDDAHIVPQRDGTQPLVLLWLVGIALMLGYAAYSELHLRRSLRVSAPLGDGVYVSDEISSPFVLGLLRPRIYLPSDLPEGDRAYVVAHERAHIRRGDNIMKPFGFLILAAYWFHPLVWLSYVLFCRDIELACDEKVVKDADLAYKKAYSEALLKCSMPRRAVAVYPVFFGESGVKARIKAVLSYKKPTFWVVVVAVLACVAVAVLFMTSPAGLKFDSVESVTRISLVRTDESSMLAEPDMANQRILTDESAEKLIAMIRSSARSRRLNSYEHPYIFSEDIVYSINLSDGSRYELHHWYANGFSFHPAHAGEYDFYNILTYFDKDGKIKSVWRMGYDFDEKFGEWQIEREEYMTEEPAAQDVAADMAGNDTQWEVTAIPLFRYLELGENRSYTVLDTLGDYVLLAIAETMDKADPRYREVGFNEFVRKIVLLHCPDGRVVKEVPVTGDFTLCYEGEIDGDTLELTFIDYDFESETDNPCRKVRVPVNDNTTDTVEAGNYTNLELWDMQGRQDSGALLYDYLFGGLALNTGDANVYDVERMGDGYILSYERGGKNYVALYDMDGERIAEQETVRLGKIAVARDTSSGYGTDSLYSGAYARETEIAYTCSAVAFGTDSLYSVSYTDGVFEIRRLGVSAIYVYPINNCFLLIDSQNNASLLFKATVAPYDFEAIKQTAEADGTIALTDAELRELEKLFEPGEEGGQRPFATMLLSSNYASPEDVHLGWLFREGTKGERKPNNITDREMEALRAAVSDDTWDFYTLGDLVKVTRADMDTLLMKYLGLTLDETNKRGMDFFTYLPEYDAYYAAAYDTRAIVPVFKAGFVREDGLIELTYDGMWGNPTDGTLVLRPTENGWLFVSNDSPSWWEYPAESIGTPVPYDSEMTAEEVVEAYLALNWSDMTNKVYLKHYIEIRQRSEMPPFFEKEWGMVNAIPFEVTTIFVPDGEISMGDLAGNTVKYSDYYDPRPDVPEGAYICWTVGIMYLAENGREWRCGAYGTGW